MILATTKVKDLDHFLEVFGTKGADKRGSHGSQGATVYRDPIEEDRVWAVFDWDEDGWTAFATDPETPGIMQEAGHLGRPVAAQREGAQPVAGEPHGTGGHREGPRNNAYVEAGARLVDRVADRGPHLACPTARSPASGCRTAARRAAPPTRSTNSSPITTA